MSGLKLFKELFKFLRKDPIHILTWAYYEGQRDLYNNPDIYKSWNQHKCYKMLRDKMEWTEEDMGAANFKQIVTRMSEIFKDHLIKLRKWLK